MFCMIRKEKNINIIEAFQNMVHCVKNKLFFCLKRKGWHYIGVNQLSASLKEMTSLIMMMMILLVCLFLEEKQI